MGGVARQFRELRRGFRENLCGPTRIGFFSVFGGLLGSSIYDVDMPDSILTTRRPHLGLGRSISGFQANPESHGSGFGCLGLLSGAFGCFAVPFGGFFVLFACFRVLLGVSWCLRVVFGSPQGAF